MYVFDFFKFVLKKYNKTGQNVKYETISAAY